MATLEFSELVEASNPEITTQSKKAILDSFFMNGMNAVNSSTHGIIEECSLESGLTVQKIKRWIHNRNRDTSQMKRPQKIRKHKVSTYDVFRSNFLKENKDMKKMATEWQKTKTDRSKMKQLEKDASARKAPTVEELDPKSKLTYAKSKIIELNKLMVNFKEAGLEVAALVYNHHNAMTVAIGSECGLAWLVGKEDLAYQFEASLSTGEQKCGEIDELRKKVQELFNQKYGDLVGRKGRCSYKEVMSGKVKVDGMPNGIDFKQPSGYGIEKLKLIMDNAENIIFTKVDSADSALVPNGEVSEENVNEITSRGEIEIEGEPVDGMEDRNQEEGVDAGEGRRILEVLANGAEEIIVAEETTEKRQKRVRKTSNPNKSSKRQKISKENIDKGDKAECSNVNQGVLQGADGEIFMIERIVRKRVKQGRKECLVKWIGYPHNENTWEPEENINYI